MSLDDLLAPVKWADEQVLRQYTKQVMEWEEKGRSRYSLAFIYGMSSLACLIIGEPHSYLLGSWQGSDMARNLFEPRVKKDSTDGSIVKHKTGPILDVYTKIGEFTRLPAFVAGLTLMGKGGIEIIDYIRNKNAESLNEGLYSLCIGYCFFGTASSIYIKDSDPKLLDKAPFWKQAYDWAKEKLASQPQPVPVHNYSALQKQESSPIK